MHRQTRKTKKSGGVDGVGGGKSRWRRFSRWFSCVGDGSEATSSFDLADAPITPPVIQSAASAELLTASPASSSAAACDQSGFLVVPRTAEEPPQLPTTGSDTSPFYPSDVFPDLPEPETLTPCRQADEAENGGSSDSALEINPRASSESLDLYVADYVERCRSIRRHEASFPHVFDRILGYPAITPLDSHATNMGNSALWMEISGEGESVSSAPLPEQDAEETNGVDSHRQLYIEEPPCVSLRQPSDTQVTALSVVVRNIGFNTE